MGNILRKIPVSARIGLAVIVLNILVSVFAPLIAPYSETELVGESWEVMSEKTLLIFQLELQQ